MGTTSAQPLGRGLVLVCLALLVAIVAAAASLEAHHGCFEAFPFAKPAAGTPRANYCEVIYQGEPWLLLIVAPTVATLVGGLLLLRRSLWFTLCLGGIVVLAVIANAVIVNELRYYAFQI